MCRDVVCQWLQYLEIHHPTFQNQSVTIDYTQLQNLPDNDLINEQLHTEVQAASTDVANDVEEEGPPEADPEADQRPLVTHGLVPNLHDRQPELEALHMAANPTGEDIVLTMPEIWGAPINEHDGCQIAIDAFPHLFPTGKSRFQPST